MSNGQADWVVVSGAAGALGAALVEIFAHRGRSVLALDRDHGGAPSEANGVRRVAVNLTAEAEVRSVFDGLERRDRLSLVVNSVGLIWNEPVLNERLQTHAIETWNRVVDANLTAAFLVASHAARRMARQGGGAIVNFSSISTQGNPGQVAYAAAKSGIEGMTRSMATELGPLGIRVNAVAPGFIDVASTRKAVQATELERLKEQTPLRRLGSIDDLVSAIDFLENNAFITGEVVALDGGLRL